MAINSKLLEEFRKQFDLAMAKIGADLGINVKLGQLNYDHDKFHARIEAIDAKQGDIYALDYRKHYYKHDFKLEWLGKEIFCYHKKFILRGFKYGSKAGIALEEVGSGKICFGHEHVVRPACIEQLDNKDN